MDQKLLFLINRQWTAPALDYFMALMSNFDAWTPPLFLGLALVLWRGGFRARAFVLTAALIVGFNDGVLGRTLKEMADRPRPHQALNDVRQVDLAKSRPRLLALGKPIDLKYSKAAEKDVDGRSFPSGHTINCISLALVTTCFYRRWGALAFLPALTVGYSRIYTGSHWPSDVGVTIFLALGAALFELCLLEWVWRKWGARVLPAIHRENPRLLPA